ncbi:MAG: dephospho-CoA kinase [Holophaga sp.]|nr:dephospho-CoA kinase [Holophaga sp.]
MTSLNARLAEAPYPIVGLTGGIAAGKTYAAIRLAASDWVVINADQVAREVVAPGTEGLADLVRAFGDGILDAEGALDRAGLAGLVFADSAQRAQLEALLHPRIEAGLAAHLAALPAGIKGVVLDAALWVERGQAHLFDALWVVDAPESIRIKRLMTRDSLGHEDALRRIRTQSAGAEKALHADQVFQNDGRDLEEPLRQAEAALLAHWKTARARKWRAPLAPPFTPEQLHTILGTLLARGGDYGEVFVEHRRSCALGMDDGRMEDILAAETFGASLRLMDQDTTRFADLISPSFEELLDAARTLAAPGAGIPVAVPPLTVQLLPKPSPVDREPGAVPLTEKVDLVRRANHLARARAEGLQPGCLRQVSLGYGDSTQNVWIAVAEHAGSGWAATLTEDRRIQSMLRLNVTAGEGDNLQTGYQSLGETRGFELFTPEAVERTVREAVRLAVQALTARPAPAGTFPVILSSSAGGTMIHEACGHGLEADLALAGVSAFAGKLGQRVAAPGVTIIDDGTLPHKRGSSASDDEGRPAQRVVLIEDGILVAYLQSRKTARRMNTESTGNGRRESYRHIPIPRMRNTFLAPGFEAPEAIVKDLDRGLLVKHMGGGQVDTVTGNFVFQVTEGYWVEQGAIQYPVKNATLTGCGPEVLMGLTRIGTDLSHFDIGTCGKDGQGVPVSDALPTILCPALIVGGTAEILPGIL